MEKFLSPFKQSRLLNALFLTNIFLSLHYYLTYYINSSFLSGSFSETQISALYIIGSVASTFFLLNASHILNRIDIHRITIWAVTIELVSTAGLAMSTTALWIGFYFITQLVTISILLFNLDIFVESASPDETQTGGIRAAYLTMSNITVFVAPAFVSILLANHSYPFVYTISALFVIPLYVLVREFRKADIHAIPNIRIRETIRVYLKDKNLYGIFNAQFLLQLFYAFMGIYTPLYLSKFVGFPWSEIGIMFSIMLLPFVIIELPLGKLADEKYGEKEFLAIGFVIMGLSTLFLSFITAKSFLIWTTVLFISRIGASFVEISSESYFFKHVNQNNPETIGFFRISRPLSFVVAPILATIILQFITFQYMFVILGAIMIYGTKYALALVDTR